MIKYLSIQISKIVFEDEMEMILYTLTNNMRGFKRKDIYKKLYYYPP